MQYRLCRKYKSIIWDTSKHVRMYKQTIFDYLKERKGRKKYRTLFFSNARYSTDLIARCMHKYRKTDFGHLFLFMKSMQQHYGHRRSLKAFKNAFKLLGTQRSGAISYMAFFFESKLSNLLVKSMLLPSMFCTQHFIKTGNILVNGVAVRKPSLVVSIGDVVSLSSKKLAYFVSYFFLRHLSTDVKGALLSDDDVFGAYFDVLESLRRCKEICAAKGTLNSHCRLLSLFIKYMHNFFSDDVCYSFIKYMFSVYRVSFCKLPNYVEVDYTFGALVYTRYPKMEEIPYPSNIPVASVISHYLYY